MVDLLTTRQVQERLKVDRITIYRMLNDGRLKGVKIGQQWRFSETEIERLLSGGVAAEPEKSTGAFPTHCVQHIQDLLVGIGRMGAVVVDNEGEPLTEVSVACQLCRWMTENPEARVACRKSWRVAAEEAERVDMHTCHAGLQYIHAPIHDGGKKIGYVLLGQVYLQSENEHSAGNAIRNLVARFPAHARNLIEAASQVQRVDDFKQSSIKDWPEKASRAIEAILSERSGLVERLQRISEMSQMDLK